MAAPSEDSRWLLERCAHSAVVRTFPLFVKMALVKLLPAEAPALADAIGPALDDERFRAAVATRLDAALPAELRAAARAALSEPALATLLMRLSGTWVAAPTVRSPPAPDDVSALFELARPQGQLDALARAPLATAARIGAARLANIDGRRVELLAFTAGQPTPPRANELRAFHALLADAAPDEVEAGLACYRGGPCGELDQAVVFSVLGAADALALELERNAPDGAQRSR